MNPLEHLPPQLLTRRQLLRQSMTAQVIVAIVWTVLAFTVLCVDIAQIGEPRKPKTAGNVIAGMFGTLTVGALIWWMALS